jgi:hypothetical protein
MSLNLERAARKEAEARADQFATQQPFGLKMDGYHCAG